MKVQGIDKKCYYLILMITQIISYPLLIITLQHVMTFYTELERTLYERNVEYNRICQEEYCTETEHKFGKILYYRNL